MQTLYLCGASTLVACALGIPIGLWASRSDRVSAIVTPIIDTLQTIPSFCFIIPVVMLFRVGDVTAMIATVAFAIVPAIRYTNHGIRQVPQQLIEAGQRVGLHALAAVPPRATAAWRCPRSCSASTRPSCWRSA